jgi:hypothetical protein
MNISRSKWWEIAFAFAGIICLILGTKWIRSGELPQQRIVIEAGGCHTPATILNPRITNEPPGTVILLHGLAANRRIMMYLASEFAGHGLQVYALDFPGHGDSTDSFSFAKSADCAAAAVESLSKSGRIDTTKTILVGHCYRNDGSCSGSRHDRNFSGSHDSAKTHSLKSSRLQRTIRAWRPASSRRGAVSSGWRKSGCS